MVIILFILIVAAFVVGNRSSSNAPARAEKAPPVDVSVKLSQASPSASPVIKE